VACSAFFFGGEILQLAKKNSEIGKEKWKK